jgi:hypothetical protein
MPLRARQNLRGGKMPSKKAIEIAAQCWCTPETEKKEMDVVLANKFANVIDGYIKWKGKSGGSSPNKRKVKRQRPLKG